MPDRFARIVASLDTPGGMMLVYLIAMVVATGIAQLTVSEFGRALIYMFAGGLANSMRGKGAENHNFDSPQTGSRIPVMPNGGSQTESTSTSSTVTSEKKEEGK